MKIGDLVTHKYDVEREIECVGLVLKLRQCDWTGRNEVLVLWASESGPAGWHYQELLGVFDESG
tara:strand:+ start:1829 stop:2020 length:192 start_codon:yes stop_codon:yes gene_type:complete